MINYLVEYLSLETIAKKWNCTIPEIIQAALLRGILIYIYTKSLKIFKIPENIRFLIRIDTQTWYYYDKSNRKTNVNPKDSNGYEAVKDGDLRVLITAKSICIHRLKSLEENHELYISDSIKVQKEDLYLHKNDFQLLTYQENKDERLEDQIERLNQEAATFYVPGKRKNTIVKEMHEKENARRAINGLTELAISTIDKYLKLDKIKLLHSKQQKAKC